MRRISVGRGVRRRLGGALLLWGLSVPAAALDSTSPVLLLDHQDRPWAAWVEHKGQDTVARVMHWDTSGWQEAGAPKSLASGAAAVALALGPDDTVWEAWPAPSPGSLRVARWTGSAWVEAGPSPSQGEAVAERPQLSIDARGRPWVLWSEVPAQVRWEHVRLAVLEGGAWTASDPGLTTPLEASSGFRTLALGADSVPLLAYGQLVAGHNGQVFVGRWNGRALAGLGGALNLDADTYAGFPTLALDALGRPTVAFLQASDGFKLEVKRWNGASWDLIGTPGSLGARSPRVALTPAGAPVLAAIERFVGITVRQRSNAGWVDLGSQISSAGAFVEALDLAVDSQGNPWVLWVEDDAHGQRLGLVRWTGTAWESVAPPPFTLPYAPASP